MRNSNPANAICNPKRLFLEDNSTDTTNTTETTPTVAETNPTVANNGQDTVRNVNTKK